MSSSDFIVQLSLAKLSELANYIKIEFQCWTIEHFQGESIEVLKNSTLFLRKFQKLRVSRKGGIGAACGTIPEGLEKMSLVSSRITLPNLIIYKFVEYYQLHFLVRDNRFESHRLSYFLYV